MKQPNPEIERLHVAIDVRRQTDREAAHIVRPPTLISRRLRLSGPLVPEELCRVLDVVAHIQRVRQVEHHLGTPQRELAPGASSLQAFRRRVQRANECVVRLCW